MKKRVLLPFLCLILSSCGDDEGDALIFSLFISFWIGVIPTMCLFWIFSLINGDKDDKPDMTVFSVISLILGMIIKALIIR